MAKVLLLESVNEPCQVYCFQEVHLADETSILQLFPSFSVVSSLRGEGRWGGLATLVAPSW